MRSLLLVGALALSISTADAQGKEYIYDLAYRAAQKIERTWLSYGRCLDQEPGGCQQFQERYVNELAPVMVEVENRTDELHDHPAARKLLIDRIDEVVKMTQLLDSANKLQGLMNQP